MSALTRQMSWQESGDRAFPWQAQVDDQLWRIRVNDFPRVRHLYTLVIDDREVEDFTDWPAAWTRPPLREQPAEPAGDRPIDPNQKDEYDEAVEKFERTKHIKPSKLVK